MSQPARPRILTLILATIIVAGCLTVLATWWLLLATSEVRPGDVLLCLAIMALALASTWRPIIIGNDLTHFVTSGFTLAGALLLPAAYTSTIFSALLLDRLLRKNRLRSRKRSLQAAFSMCNGLLFTQLAVLPIRLVDPHPVMWPLHLLLLLTAVGIASVPSDMLVFLMASLDAGQPWRTVAGNTRQTYIADMIVTYLGALLAELWQQQPWDLVLALVAMVPAYWLLRKVQAIQQRALQEQARATAAEELARMRGDFVASVSHELRTPLTAIVGYAELLEARWTTLTEETRRDHVRRIALSANRQRRLVEDLLLTSRLELQPFSVRRQPVSLAAQIAVATSDVRGSYPGQRIETSGPPEVRVLADPARLVQVLTNILDNAAKYSPEGSAIEVRWHVDAKRATVHVRDHGPGIPAEARQRLFTRFGRLPGSVMRAGRSGTGLGLFLARQLTGAMGGSLDLADSGPHGSTFRLQLPLAPD